MAKNNVPHNVKCGKGETILVHAKLKGAGAAAALTKNEPFKFGSAVTSVTYGGSAGLHTIVFTDKFPQLLSARVDVHGATAGLKGRFTAIDVAAGTATLQLEVGAVATNAATTDDIYITLYVRNQNAGS